MTPEEKNEVSRKIIAILEYSKITLSAAARTLEMPAAYISMIKNPALYSKLPAWAWDVFNDIVNGKENILISKEDYDKLVEINFKLGNQTEFKDIPKAIVLPSRREGKIIYARQGVTGKDLQEMKSKTREVKLSDPKESKANEKFQHIEELIKEKRVTNMPGKPISEELKKKRHEIHKSIDEKINKNINEAEERGADIHKNIEERIGEKTFKIDKKDVENMIEVLGRKSVEIEKQNKIGRAITLLAEAFEGAEITISIKLKP